MYFHRHYLLKVLLLLTSGVFVYWICRPGMLLFQWLQIDGVAEANSSGILKLLNNYYGDLVWVTALCMITFYLAERKLTGFPSVVILFSLPFISEILQLSLVIPGVFDWYDLAIYSIVICFFLIRFPKHLLWKN
jgi:hypothetical protein